MRKLLFLSLFTLVLTACGSVSGVNAVIVRDCTGTYVRVAEKDYLVCNIELLDKVDTGDTVRVRFQPIEKCARLDTTIVCMMYHPNEGKVQLKKVNSK